MYGFPAMPIVFVNCKSVPFIDAIMNRSKVYETRSANTLRSLIGERVLLCETGKGASMVRCSAVIKNAFPVNSFHEWDMFRYYTRIPLGSEYDWKPDTKVKWLYELMDVRPVPVPFHPKAGKMHGRVWMEYNGAE